MRGFKFSNSSQKKLNSCDLRLIQLFNTVIKDYDCTVLYGHRSPQEQFELWQEGREFINGKWEITGTVKTYMDGHNNISKHNIYPSPAIDVAPFIKGKVSFNRDHCVYFAGIVMRIAEERGLKLVWGGNWNRDDEIMTDQTFQDLLHFELG